MNKVLILYTFLGFLLNEIYSTEMCSKREDTHSRFLLYDINPGEGFNLRRDVYLRIANLVGKLNYQEKWTLVLPPWGNLYHWRMNENVWYFPWKDFFDVNSLNQWISVIELKDYLNRYKNRIERSFLLQHYSEGWGEKFEEKFDLRPCLEPNNYRKSGEYWVAYMWNEYLTFSNFSCISLQGQASVAIPLITGDKSTRSVLIDHAETLLHDEYGGRDYWSVRRSMRFSNTLVREADDFRRMFLNSTDELDETVVSTDWRDHKPRKGSALGGRYLAIHLRRRDFLRAHPNELPSMPNAAQQIKKYLKKWNLSKVFVATDAPQEEILELKHHLGFDIFTYKPSNDFLKRFGSGGVAIIDQIICSHGSAFSGSFESTFSFRIQEEREILGFPADTTFNRLCGKKSTCEQPSRWLIAY